MLMRPSRRPRARHGAQLCAVISAVLLLVSVSLLYTRLSLFSSSHSHSPYLSHHDSQNDAVLDSLLVSDSSDENDGVSNEDKIDEHDDSDENRNDAVSDDAEEDYDNGDEAAADQSKVSSSSASSGNGYYFDHVTGAIRRGFSKRSIDDWDYNNDYAAGFTIGSESGVDRSKEAFGSDDVPVEESIRRKMNEVLGIEDALLLKSAGGKRVSPLREGWGDWFDRKSDFLRRDRMFKSNLEVLNPLNNPMLQDPDGVGVTGLTRGDKIMQKWILNSEFKRVPFMSKKPLSVFEKRDEANGKVKGAERKTLDDNLTDRRVKNGDGDPKLGGSLNESNGNGDANTLNESGKREKKTSSMDYEARESKNEFSGHIYADGSRWGYYPGLDPSLSFSDFMDSFFRKEKCGMRVFMVWNSPPWMFSVRHQRSLESLLSQHGDACVVVFSETIELDFFQDSFVKNGYKISVAMPNLDELLKDTPTHVFASVWFDWRKTKYYATHYSELVRLAALYKYGGIYLDSDIITLRSLSALRNTIGTEDQAAGGSLNGAVMAFEKHSPFILECLTEYYLTYDDKCLRCNGADLLTRVGKKILNGRNRRINQPECTIQPSSVFFPISSQDITRYFTSPATEIERARQEALFKKIVDESLTFHFWNSITSSLTPEPESLVTRFLDRFCIHCSDVL